jgi:hypothetical protein
MIFSSEGTIMALVGSISGSLTAVTGTIATLNTNITLDGDIAVNGGDLTTTTSGTFNLLNTTLTGTLNVAGVATTVSVGGIATTSSFSGDIAVGGRTNISTVVEKMSNSNSSTGIVTFDLGVQGIFYVNGPAGNITANFTNVPTTTNRVITPTVILSQSSTARILSGCQIDGTWQTINWANGTTPTGNANKQDVFGFSLIRSGSAWKVLGQMSTYG